MFGSSILCLVESPSVLVFYFIFFYYFFSVFIFCPAVFTFTVLEFQLTRLSSGCLARGWAWQPHRAMWIWSLLLLDMSVSSTVQVGNEDSMEDAGRSSVEGKVGELEMHGAHAEFAGDDEHRPEMPSIVVDTTAMPPSVAEIVAVINEKQKAALHATMAGVKAMEKFSSSPTVATFATSIVYGPSTDNLEKHSATCKSKGFGLRPKRCSAIGVLRILTVELKRSKLSSPTEYEHILVSDVDQGLVGSVTLSTTKAEKQIGAGKSVLVAGNDDVQGAAAFVRQNAKLHEVEIRARCISALNLHSMAGSNLGVNHASNQDQNCGLSLCIQRAAAAFAICPNPNQQQLVHVSSQSSPMISASCHPPLDQIFTDMLLIQNSQFSPLNNLPISLRF